MENDETSFSQQTDEDQPHTQNLQTQASKTYAYATANYTFPKKDQAIVVEWKDGIPIQEYASALVKLVDSTSIRFISRISNKRICIFLSNKILVQELSTKKLKIRSFELEIRPLIMSHKRVIISNVCPIIPHETITGELERRGIIVTSSISFLRAGMSDPGFSHILSFRRQVYIKPEDAERLPESLQIEFEDTKYWIYLSTDPATCFICKQQGHIAKACPTNLEDQQVVSPQHSSSESPAVIINQESNDNNTMETNIHSGIKRPLSISTTASDPSSSNNTNNLSDVSQIPGTGNISTQNENENENDNSFQIPKKKAKKVKKSNKKVKTENSENIKKSIEELLNPLKEIIEASPNEFALDLLQFKSFIENATRSPNAVDVAKNYTSNPQVLVDMIQKVHPYLTDRGIKSRCTRIKNKLIEQTQTNEKALNMSQTEDEEESDSSESESGTDTV